MIYDSLERLALYRGLHPNLDKAIDHFLRTDFGQQASGRYDVEGEKVFNFIQENVLNQISSDALEVH